MTQRQEAEKLVKIIRPYPIEHLYRYRPFPSRDLEDIFVNRRIYLPDATKFNDPFECRPAVTYHANSMKRSQYLKEMTKARFPGVDRRTRRKLMKGKASLMTNEALLRHSYDKLVTSIGVYCLSEKRDDLLMWSHYADSHRGLCIEFNAKTVGTLFWEAFKVIYQDDYPIVNIMDLGNCDEFRKALLTKCACWRHEEERRILKMEDDGGPGYYTFGPECLTGVVFGALMSEEDKTRIVSWIDGYPSSVALYQAKLNGRSYKLDIELVQLNTALKPTRKPAAVTGKLRGRAA